MSRRTEPQPRSNAADDDASLGEVIDYVKAYAQQETVGPLKGAGRWLGFGLAGSLALGMGLLFVLLGVLRMLQTEFDSWATTGAWSWAAYFALFVVAAVLLFLTVRRIQQDTLSKEPK